MPLNAIRSLLLISKCILLLIQNDCLQFFHVCLKQHAYYVLILTFFKDLICDTSAEKPLQLDIKINKETYQRSQNIRRQFEAKMRKNMEKFDDALSKIKEELNDNVPKMLDIVMNFLKQNKGSSLSDEKIKEMVISAAEKNFPSQGMDQTAKKETEKEKFNHENDWKLAHVSVRGKKERQLLKGFACNQCEPYYKMQNLTKEQLHEVMQKCSKHRSKVVLPINSPNKG